MSTGRGIYKYIIPAISHEKKTTKLTPYENLAIEICTLAAMDYRKELLKEKKTGQLSTEARRIERFFNSDRGYLFSFGKGELILEKIQEEVNEINASSRNKTCKRY